MAHYPTSISAQTMVGIQSPPSLTISGTNGYNNYNNYNTISTQGINNTLTTSQIQGLYLNTISGLNTVTPNATSVDRYEVFDVPHDIIALCVVADRIGERSALNEKTISSLTQSDIDLANEIREYYSHKFVCLILKDIKLNSYYQNIKPIIESNGKIFKENVLNSIRILPATCYYHKEIDTIKAKLVQSGLEKLNSKKTSMTLTPLIKVEQSYLQHTNVTEYWLKNNYDQAVMISVSSDTPLIAVWNYYFNTKKSITINGYYSQVKLDGFEYFSINNWEIENI